MTAERKILKGRQSSWRKMPFDILCVIQGLGRRVMHDKRNNSSAVKVETVMGRHENTTDLNSL